MMMMRGLYIISIIICEILVRRKKQGKFKRWRISRITRVDEALLDWEGEWAMRNNRECTVPTDPFYYAHIVKHSKGVSQMSSRLHG